MGALGYTTLLFEIEPGNPLPKCLIGLIKTGEGADSAGALQLNKTGATYCF